MALKAWHFVALATVLAFGLAWYQLGYEPFWFDEFMAWRGAHQSFADIWSYAARDYHPPLYFWFLHGWIGVGAAPLDEVWLRLPSVFFFALTVPVAYHIGRTLAGSPRAGVYAAFLLATWPYLFHYARYARPYAMLTFFAACAFLAVLHLMSRFRTAQSRPRWPGAGLPEAGRLLARGELRRSWRALGDDGLWGLYIVSSVAVMGLHYTAGIFPVVTGLTLLCAIGMAPSFRGVRFAGLGIAMAAIAILWSPQIPHLLFNLERFAPGNIPPTDMGRIVHVFWRLYDNGYFPFVVLAGVVAGAMGAWAWRREWDRLAFVGFCWLGPPVLLIAFSFWSPLLQAKLLLWTLVPFLAVCGAGIALVPWSFVRVLLVAALLASSSREIVREWEFVKEDWRSVPRLIPRAMSPDAAVLLCPGWYRELFEHYWKKEGRGDLNLHIVDIFDRQKIFAVNGSAGGSAPEVDPAGLFAQHPEVLLIWTGGCRGRFDFPATVLGEQGRLTREWSPEGVQIRLYERNE